MAKKVSTSMVALRRLAKSKGVRISGCVGGGAADYELSAPAGTVFGGSGCHYFVVSWQYAARNDHKGRDEAIEDAMQRLEQDEIQPCDCDECRLLDKKAGW